MAKSKKSKENNIVGSVVTPRVKQKRFCRRDSSGTDSAVEGPSPAENCRNGVSRATRAAEQAKQKPIATTKQVETALVVATSSTIPPAARVTRWSTQLAAHFQPPLPPNTTSKALMTQHELARSYELCGLQQKEGSCWSQVTVACFFICSLTV